MSLASSYFRIEEYLRAAHVARFSEPTNPSYFIGAYARFLYADMQTMDTSKDMLG